MIEIRYDEARCGWGVYQDGKLLLPFLYPTEWRALDALAEIDPVAAEELAWTLC